MNPQNIERAIRDLSAILGRVKSHLAWLEVERDNRPLGGPLITSGQQRTLEDLRNDVVFFHKLFSDVCDALDSAQGVATLPETLRAQWRARAPWLDHALNRLNLPKGI